MSDDTDLDIVRRAYAKQIMANFGVVDRRVEAAFASVKREHYLGRGPWQVIRWGRGYVLTPSRDPVYLIYKAETIVCVRILSGKAGSPPGIQRLPSPAGAVRNRQGRYCSGPVGRFLLLLTPP
jgi:hypothetical protein